MDSKKENFAGRGFVELLQQFGDAGSVEGEGFLYPTRFLCYEGGEIMGSSEQSRGVLRSAVTGSDSSSTSSSCSGVSFSQSTIPTKGNEAKSEQNTQICCESSSSQVFKRPKTTAPSKTVRSKEKLGDRIAALQQLVSPFGKTDTASVLHEAMGYIKFLHDQVQVLSSPYMQSLPSASSSSGEKEEGEEERCSLRRRGLCLVSVESTVQVASSNGADLWSPAMGNTNSSSSNL